MIGEVFQKQNDLFKRGVKGFTIFWQGIVCGRYITSLNHFKLWLVLPVIGNQLPITGSTDMLFITSLCM